MHDIQKRIVRLARRENIAELGYRRLGQKLGIEHPQQVKYHLQKLINMGHLVRTPEGQLKISKPGDLTAKMLSVPILGQANCGEPLSLGDETPWGYLKLSPSIVPKRSHRLFAVKAVGDSMNRCRIDGQAIEEGDYAIVDASVDVPNNGDIVVSSIEGLANIKKFIRDEANRLIMLVSQSTKQLPPIVIDTNDSESYRVHGQVVKVIKMPDY